MSDHVIALDCGTHAIRAVAFEIETGQVTECAIADIALQFPQPGWVELDPDELGRLALSVVREALSWARERNHRIRALAITNMRETAFAWDRETGQALAPAVMWMSMQSEPVVERWRNQGLEPFLRERTGLTNDSFFFGSKLTWLLENVPAVAQAQREGRLAVGTVDSWLIHVLTAGREHRTDTSNGSRTQLMNLQTRQWDPELADMVGVRIEALPTLTDSSGNFGLTDGALCGMEIPIIGVMADQQASLLGHGGEEPGSLKATFGTSGVVCANTGDQAVLVDGMVTSVGWTGIGEPCFETEGSAFHSGYTLVWLREKFGLELDTSVDLEQAADDVSDRVFILPSFTRMGAPRWPATKGAVISGLGMDTTGEDVLRAGVEAMVFQIYDMIVALGTSVHSAGSISVDGGGSKNNYLCQMLANLSDRRVFRSRMHELTSAGVAKAALAGLGLPVPRYFGQDPDQIDTFDPVESSYAREGYEHWAALVEGSM